MDWAQIEAICGIVAFIVGGGVVYLRLFVSGIVSKSENQIREYIDGQYQRRELVDEKMKNFDLRITRLEHK